MADDVLQELILKITGEVGVDKSSAKKAGEDAGEAFKDGMEDILRDISLPSHQLASIVKKTDFSEMAKTIKGKVSKQLFREQNKINQSILQDSIRSGMSHADKQAMYEQMFGSPSAEFFSNIKDFAVQAQNSLYNAINGNGLLAKGSMWIGGKLKDAFGYATISPIKKLGGAIADTTQRLHGFFSAIKRIAVYRAIRWALKQITQGFQEGIQNAYQWSVITGNQFARSMDMMATSALYLKNSLGAMAMPLVNYLAPILDQLTDQFVNLINVVNRFIATITGASSWTKALKYPAQYMDSMAGSAKELKNQLLSFDDLNVLNAPSGSSSASAMDYSNMFQQMELAGQEVNFTKSLMEAIKSSDWDALEELLDKQINGLIEKIDAKGISKALGEKLNKAIRLVHTLLKAVDFQQIGQKIGEFISNLQLDWGLIASSWVRWNINMFNAIVGIIRNINWTNVANAITDYFSTMFYDLGQWFLSIDWRVEAEKFMQSVINFIRTIDWFKIATNLLGAIASMFLAVIDSFTGGVRALWRLIVGDTSGLNDAVRLLNNTAQSFSASANTEGRGGYNILGGGGRQYDPTIGYASGGFPETGSYFYAGENGAEFVGQVGGRTAVYNADQMTGALATANEGVVNTLTAVGNAIVSAINHKDMSINTNDVRRAISGMNMRYGV